MTKTVLAALLRRVGKLDPALADQLAAEIKTITGGRELGLIFDRHIPETVELPGRKVRAFDKVRVRDSGDETPWLVTEVRRDKTGRVADLTNTGDDTDTRTERVVDLVVVADFRDPIYPGLVSTGKVDRGGDKPFHTVINAENFHTLQTLLYTHEGKVDAIYIDPPYNTGARDWKYNNDYVDADDSYRHSKWLAFMERRLKLARRLLNPDDSVLIVTIDEKEYLRLGLLLEQVFPEADIQMVSDVINRAGSPRANRFSRVDEYVFFVFIGDAGVTPWTSTMLGDDEVDAPMPTVWFTAVRRGSGSGREDKKSGKASFYPVIIHKETGAFIRVGDPLPHGVSRHDVPLGEGELAIWPLANDGRETRWRFSSDVMRRYFANGTARLGKRDPVTGLRPVTYLQPGTLENIENGTFVVHGRTAEGALELGLGRQAKAVAPRTVWSRTGHFARDHGSNLLGRLLPGRRFPFPKALYAVEDTLRFVVGDKPDAVIVDFFSGSGTTAHAVMRLNRQDSGRRISISVTNNEVGADEQAGLRARGLRPGDPEWERWGICDYITKPRIEAAITGRTPSGEPVKGDYRFTDEFPMQNGFDENVEFFTLTYEDVEHVRVDMAFEAVAPLLWLRAGATGSRIDKHVNTFAVADHYGILFDPDQWKPFVKALAELDDLRCAYVVTDEDSVFQAVARHLPDVDKVRLYESYLHNFEFSHGKGISVEIDLRPYQMDAAKAVLNKLARAVDEYRGKYNSRSWFALTAMPSAGKTVIAAAVIEALFRGSDEWGNDPDPNGIVLWLTDDESLNNQTLKKMLAASELDASQLVSINSPHFPDILDPQTVYFLNVQKLYGNSTKYTKPTQDRPYDLWNTISATSRADDRNLYLVIDEAHKGMSQESGRETTVLKLINGNGENPPVPVVWGISATAERFQKAMERSTDRTHLPDWDVPIDEVRASGLLKDRVILRYPEAGRGVDTSIVRHAVRYTMKQSHEWADYCQSQNRDIVLPLLLVQVENDPSEAELSRIISAIQEEWEAAGEQLSANAIAHVFGHRNDVEVAGRAVRHVPPESVQDLTDIRVLLAIHAVTTGWDCPRAEVLVSLRGSGDATVITQLMGRMFRTPLAERVPGRDSLNTAICLLPKFNRRTTEGVAERLQKGDEATPGGMDATEKPTATYTKNAALPHDVFELFESLPSESKPDPVAKPIPRLFSMATALAGDELLSDANAKAQTLLFAKLDGQLSEHADAVAEAREAIITVKLAGTVVSLGRRGTTLDTGVAIRGDARAIDAAFSAAARSLTKAVTVGYQKHRAQKVAAQTGQEIDLVAAKLDVAALATVPAVADALNQAAVEQVKDWFDTYDAALLSLADERQASYERIRSTGPEPMRRHTTVPENKVEPTADAEDAEPYTTADRHLLCDEHGQFPIGQLGGWERQVVETELAREGAGEIVAWYRNPSHAVETAFRIPYKKADGTWSSFQPDFAFFSRKADDSLAASLIEPHRDQGDTLWKLRGWADFTERYPDGYLRAEFISANRAGQLVKLALTDADTRAAIRAPTADAKLLFDGPSAKPYL